MIALPMAEIESGTPTTNAPNPWGFVPSLYFLQGLPVVIVQSLSVTIYSTMGVPIEQIGLWTSLIAWPWTVKMLWGPLVDNTATKRAWILGMQALIIIALGLIAFAVTTPAFLPVTLAGFFLIAFLSATHDIAADGFYLLALQEDKQAFFVGVRSAFFRMAMIFGPGVLVIIAGRIADSTTATRAQVATSWQIALLIGTVVYALGWLWHLKGLPRPVGDPPRERFALAAVLLRFSQVLLMLATLLVSVQFLVMWFNFAATRPIDSVFWMVTGNDNTQNYWQIPVGVIVVILGVLSTRNMFTNIGMGPAAKEYFSQNRIVAILAFIFFYRFGESMIGKMNGPFLLATYQNGGLGVTTEMSGWLIGGVGVLALTVGGILGGTVISKYGIKSCIWPMVLSLNLPNIFYVWAAFTKPDLIGVAAVIAIDQYGYGFGFSAYMVYLMYLSQDSKFKTSHYAISTGLMALGAMLAGILSGYLLSAMMKEDPKMGYAWFFVAVCLFTIPGMMTLFFIPMDKEDLKVAPVELD
ncbi:ProP Permeases of the major facilitator superfamily [Fimbriimonadaceae bacterium]